MAAPLFARIAEPALRRLAIAPDDPDRVLRATAFRPEMVRAVSYLPAVDASGATHAAETASAGSDPGLMPDLRGASAREAATAAARLGLIVDLQGTGRVAMQSPAAGAEIEAGMTCVLQLGGDR